MKRITAICIISGGNGGDNLLCEMYNHVKDDIPKEWRKTYEYSGRGQLVLPLEDNSPSYQYVMEIAEKHELHPSVFQTVYYTKAEIEKVEYFQMNILLPLEIEGTDASDYGTLYKGGCSNPKCRLGKKLIGDALVDRKFMKKWDIGTLSPDIYVSERLRDLISINNLSGVSFNHAVKDYKGRDMQNFYVAEISHILPPMASSSWLIHDENIHPWYNECGHHVVYLRSDPQYEKDKLVDAKDFNLSKEYVDNKRLQKIIVSAKVRSLFKQNKVHASFVPVSVL